jgi:hypothetical protein
MDNRNRIPQHDAHLEAARRLAERAGACAKWRRGGRRADSMLPGGASSSTRPSETSRGPSAGRGGSPSHA